MADQSPDVTNAQDQDSKSHRFRFKRKHECVGEGCNHEHRHRRQHHSHRESKRMRSTRVKEDHSEYGYSTSDLPPDMAFRESLFDALGDDEGAAYWQGVYGQPIHTYPKTVRNEESGELETMSDEEYATFVRRKMWEKSWEGIEVAREKRRREKAEQKKQAERPQFDGQDFQYSSHDFVFDLEVENSLKRGAERKTKRRWKALWAAYVQRWEELQSLYEDWKRNEANAEQLFLRNKIAWPVESGKRKDLNEEEVERFIRKCTASLNSDEGEDPLLPILRAERIRFHPDKIQQRFSFMNLDPTTIQGVTEVFQILDRLWNELRPKQT